MTTFNMPSPRVPAPLALPLGLMPGRLHSRVLAPLLNRLFAAELAAGELDFLDQRSLLIRVEDLGISYRLGLSHGRLVAAEPGPHHLSIEGSTYDFLLLASRREDPDTLFFNRRLRLGGDTELGLYLKNFLDAVELDGRLGKLQAGLDRLGRLMERLTPSRRA